MKPCPYCKNEEGKVRIVGKNPTTFWSECGNPTCPHKSPIYTNEIETTFECIVKARLWWENSKKERRDV